MKIFEYNVLKDHYAGGRAIPDNHAVRFWLDDTSFIEISAGDGHRGEHVLVRASGHKTQLQIEPEVSNTIRVGLK